MIKVFNFDYNGLDASATFHVDERFTNKMALDTLEFFRWDIPYNKNGDPIKEVMNKYAMACIRLATVECLSTVGTIEKFNEMEGYYPIDGSKGIRLTNIIPYELDEDLLDLNHYEEIEN